MKTATARMLACTALWSLSAAASADHGRSMPSSVPRAYLQECASCHIAYSPGLLPAASWQRVMKGLDRHYGTDASLDPASIRLIASWLEENAGRGKHAREAPPEDRITRTVWFERKHRKIEDSIWRLSSVKSAANCQACHTDAGRGHYSDDRLRIPAGVSGAQLRAFRD